MYGLTELKPRLKMLGVIWSTIQTLSGFSKRVLVELKNYRGVPVGLAGASLASLRPSYVNVFTPPQQA